MAERYGVLLRRGSGDALQRTEAMGLTPLKALGFLSRKEAGFI